MTARPQKRLSAVLAAEAVTIGAGNSLRMEAWLGILGSYKSAFAGQIERAGGTVIGRARTAILAEFATIVNAVECALKFQRSVSIRNRGLPQENRVYFRMGLHVGEIILGGDILTGIGVKTATELDAAAAPGGILISGQAYDLISNLKTEFEPAAALASDGGGPELRVYAGPPDPSISFQENVLSEKHEVDTTDITVLDLSNQFPVGDDATTVTGTVPVIPPPPAADEDLTTAPDFAGQMDDSVPTAEETIARIEELLLQADAYAKNTNYYHALQDYDQARRLAEDLGQLAPERQSSYLERLREDTIALENSFALEGEAVIEFSGQPFVLRLADTLEIGRGREGAVVGCNTVSRVGHQTRISIENDLFQITDIDSRNGTFIDGRCLGALETYTMPAERTSLTIHLGGNREPGQPGPVCIDLTQIRGKCLALLLRMSPSDRVDQAGLQKIWPSMAADCSLTYVFSNGPVLIGNRDDCAVKLNAGGADALASMEFTRHYLIAPHDGHPIKINDIDFVRPVVLSDHAEVEVEGLQFKIHARHMGASAD